MPGHRFFSPFEITDKEIILKDPDEFQHLAKVLRLKAGDVLEIINGRGDLARGTIADVTRSSVLIKLQDIISAPLSSGPKITLACAIPKKAKFEFIIEKCTELGVDRIVPLMSERTEYALDGERGDKKAERFRRVVMNAAKQSKRLWFPEVAVPVLFETALKDLAVAGARLFIPWLEGERVLLGEALVSAAGCREIIFFIGPEGDFTPEEVALAVKSGAVPVSLGVHVLKVDTAAIAVVAAAKLGIPI